MESHPIEVSLSLSIQSINPPSLQSVEQIIIHNPNHIIIINNSTRCFPFDCFVDSVAYLCDYICRPIFRVCKYICCCECECINKCINFCFDKCEYICCKCEYICCCKCCNKQ